MVASADTTTTLPATLSAALLRPPGGGAGIALIGRDRSLSFDELETLVGERIGALGLPERSLVVLAGANSLDWVVTYLALLEGGHVPLLAGDHADRLASTWGATALITTSDDGFDLVVNDVPSHRMHPDLAVLVSTSGSTGSPKLVRLSHRNLISNAASIGEYLHLTAHDRAITSLPLHYCYGLSVLHSHLLAGAGVVVTDRSVVDPCFRSSMREHGVTNLAGVPHSFEMLDRVGPDTISTPSLRLVTQAGGRMTPAAVSAWAERARSWDAEFFVMYGQTEATARIAYLPPELATRRPEAIGVPIPGTTIALRPIDGWPDDVGELVVNGPNVMMGYATEAADLEDGDMLSELRTGDLARFHADDGVYEIVGRRSRFVKPFGLRIDLDDVEARLTRVVPEAAVAGDDDRIVAFAEGGDGADITSLLSEITGLPSLSIRVHDAPVPRTASGKVDAAAMLAAPWADVTEPELGLPDDDSVDVARLFAEMLGRPHVDPGESFVSLGGDSLSYVECSIRLERAIGHLPADWHVRPISSLAAAPAAPRRRLARLDTTVFLRALGICLVVATHMRLWHIPGGAHALLAVAGYNLARFMTPLETPGARLRAGLRTAGRAAIPTMIWVAVGMAVFGSYGVGTLLLINNYIGPASHDGDAWHFWFIEVFVHLVVLATLLSAIPAVRRAERRYRYLAPLALLGVAVVLRLDWSHMGDWYNLRFRTHGVAWFFALGWLIQRSRSMPQRAVTTLVCLAVIPGFFRIAEREWRIAAMLLLLLWVRELPFPRWAVRPVGVLAAASMWIYVSHFSIWPIFRQFFIREAAYVLTIAAGVGVWFAAERLLGLLNTWRQERRRTKISTPTMFRGIVFRGSS